MRIVSLVKYPASRNGAVGITGEMTNEQRARLLTETQDTATRLNKLNVFMATPEFPKLERSDKTLLYKQQRVMSEYVEILGTRLERAGKKFEHAE